MKLKEPKTPGPLNDSLMLGVYGKKVTASKNRSLRNTLLKIFNKDNRCCYCQCRVTMIAPPHGTSYPKNMATVEHVYPRVDIRRGAKDADNIIKLACMDCNMSQSDQFIMDALAWYDYEKQTYSLVELLKIKLGPYK